MRIATFVVFTYLAFGTHAVPIELDSINHGNPVGLLLDTRNLPNPFASSPHSSKTKTSTKTRSRTRSKTVTQSGYVTSANTPTAYDIAWPEEPTNIYPTENPTEYSTDYEYPIKYSTGRPSEYSTGNPTAYSTAYPTAYSAKDHTEYTTAYATQYTTKPPLEYVTEYPTDDASFTEDSYPTRTERLSYPTRAYSTRSPPKSSKSAVAPYPSDGSDHVEIGGDYCCEANGGLLSALDCVNILNGANITIPVRIGQGLVGGMDGRIKGRNTDTWPVGANLDDWDSIDFDPFHDDDDADDNDSGSDGEGSDDDDDDDDDDDGGSHDNSNSSDDDLNDGSSGGEHSGGGNDDGACPASTQRTIRCKSNAALNALSCVQVGDGLRLNIPIDIL